MVLSFCIFYAIVFYVAKTKNIFKFETNCEVHEPKHFLCFVINSFQFLYVNVRKLHKINKFIQDVYFDIQGQS